MITLEISQWKTLKKSVKLAEESIHVWVIVSVNPMNEQRLENIRLRLCSVGLHPKYHDTPEKAVESPSAKSSKPKILTLKESCNIE